MALDLGLGPGKPFLIGIWHWYAAAWTFSLLAWFSTGHDDALGNRSCLGACTWGEANTDDLQYLPLQQHALFWQCHSAGLPAIIFNTKRQKLDSPAGAEPPIITLSYLTNRPDSPFGRCKQKTTKIDLLHHDFLGRFFLDLFGYSHLVSMLSCHLLFARRRRK
ncbi:hypothetical protein CERZMDRAFT_91028 [Cercospora zeae-maydis SCOH1-5]|uniref:Uncharacterized protein n=1 Tax=Cercospora zeae-maydis SCOH1-5 TaxID=717836 RepID=A0A6A6FCE7_9PEZI|nr:hypothetical protein CERZMDRAFT_91028 [Cercospora zeae-maydis SCOH1-5]